MSKPRFITPFLSGILAMAAASQLQAAELKLIAGGSMTASMNAIAPQFEKATGHKLITISTLPPTSLRASIRGRRSTWSSCPSMSSGCRRQGALCVCAARRYRPGRLRNYRSRGCAEAGHLDGGRLQEALLAAPSIAFLPASAAGAYITKVFERLGIGEEMKAKTKVQTAPAAIAPAVAKGEAELGVFLTNVLIAPGVELVGLFRATCNRSWCSPRQSPPTPRKPTPQRR